MIRFWIRKSGFGFSQKKYPFSGYTWNVLLENVEVIYHYSYVESLGSENMKDLVNFAWVEL